MAESIRQARLHAGLSQAELARLAGISQSNLCAIETGARRASPAMVRRIMDAMTRPSERLRRHRAEVLELIAKSGATNPRVFGSVARGEDTPESDLDLLVALPLEKTWGFALPSELGELLGIPVDVVLDSAFEPRRDNILVDAVAL